MTTVESIESVLEGHPFFKDIEPRLVHQMAEHASLSSFATGQMIFRQGEAANQFYIISKGQVALEVFAPQQGAIPLMTLSDGDVLGWSWLFEPYTWHLDARAMVETQTITLDGAGLRAECDRNHELGYHLMKHSVEIVVQRLQAALMQVIDVYGLKKQ